MSAYLMLSVLAFAPLAAPPPSPAVGLVADYDNELRGPDGHVDVPLLVSQLKALGVNSYFFLVWHAPTDWDDLQAFLPAARKAGIDVWVYLCPPSEPPPGTPFGLDFVRWGEEIARLSLKFPNLRAWVIDDFYANSATLTPAYLADCQRAARKINPALKFFALMYFPEIHSEFMEAYAPVVDGVVVAYPSGPQDIRRAAKVLRGQVIEPSSCVMSYPYETPSQPGDFAEVGQFVTVTPGAPRYTIAFSQRDDFVGPTAGYHFKQLIVDGEVAWEEDVAGGDTDWHDVTLDVTDRVGGKNTVAVALRCIDKQGVSNFGIHVRFSDLKLQGFAVRSLAAGDKALWQVISQGKWDATFRPRPSAAGQFRLPYVVMTAAEQYEYKLRRPGSGGTPAEIGAHFKMALDEMAAGNCDGVVTYCLPKQPGDPYFAAVRSALAGFRKQHP